jgi:hypothetical protein
MLSIKIFLKKNTQTHIHTHTNTHIYTYTHEHTHTHTHTESMMFQLEHVGGKVPKTRNCFSSGELSFSCAVRRVSAPKKSTFSRFYKLR